MKIIIIGAGIGGLSAAIALRQAGHEVKIFERAPELTEVGAGISLWANAFYALDKIGIGDSIRVSCQPFVQGEIRVQGGRRIVGSFTAQVLNKTLETQPVMGIIHRAELVHRLAEQVPSQHIQLGATCVDVSQANDQVVATFADGRRDQADLLVGADGIRSIVRAKILGDQPARYSGYTCFRGVTSRPNSIHAGYAGEWWGAGQRVGITTLPDDRVYWWATFNAPANQHFSDPAGEVRRRFADWAAPLPELLHSTPDEAILHNDIIDRPPSKPWAHGRIVLIGDAAHPTTPNLGQGGCMAIEDAVELPRYLGSSASLVDALKSFTDDRYPRTAAITNESWRMGQVGQWEGALACWFRDLGMSLLMKLAGPASFTKNARYQVGSYTAKREF